MTTPTRSSFFILCLLGALSVVSPFAIDLYLPAFGKIAEDLGSTSAIVSLSLSTYFIGMALGQFIYGPLLDRFGRKKPIYVGLAIFCFASLGCMFTTNVDALIALRLLQGLGGCVAQVGAMAMVHDFFPVDQRAKIFSLLFLFISVSPLLAPTVGSFLTLFLSWRAVFAVMFVITLGIIAAMFFLLPEGHKPDPTISLHPKDIAITFFDILKNRIFLRYAVSGALSFAGLFTLIAGAPIIFLEQFHVDPRFFGMVFIVLAGGFIGGSQINVFLLRRLSSVKIFNVSLPAQVIVSLIALIGTYMGWFGFVPTLIVLACVLLCAGMNNPNGSALALMPFDKNAGSASALLGAMQIGAGALVSTSVGILHTTSSLPVIGMLFTTALLGLIIYWFLRPVYELGNATA